jgi:hypothetical protein
MAEDPKDTAFLFEFIECEIHRVYFLTKSQRPRTPRRVRGPFLILT